MKKYLFLIMLFLVIPMAVAYYPNQTIDIKALYTENDVPVSVFANITIEKPNEVIDVYNKSMTEYETGKFNYTYTLDELIGDYLMTVEFYNSSWDLQGITQGTYFVEYNYTEDINNISQTVQDNRGFLSNIWDWIQTTIFDTKTTSTNIIGKIMPYQNIVFKTENNWYPTICEIVINEVAYNMTVNNKIAYYNYYIPNEGIYNWSVSCT